MSGGAYILAMNHLSIHRILSENGYRFLIHIRSMSFLYNFIIKHYDIDHKTEFDCKIKSNGEDVLLRAFVLTRIYTS